MTTNYLRVASTSRPTTFFRLLFLWRSSLWKAVHFELMMWLSCYLVISCTYRWVLRDSPGGKLFEQVVLSMNDYLTLVSSSLNFVLGFYVTYIATRWWWVFNQIPWPDSFYALLSGFFRSTGEHDKKYERNIRMSINRYWNAAFIMVMRDISESARKRFPTLDHLVPAVLTEEEVDLIEKIGFDDPHLQSTCFFFVPIDWINKLLKKAHHRGNLSTHNYTTLVQEVNKTREKLNNLLSQDFLSSVPLSYSQVASFVPIIYFVLSLIGRQFVRSSDPSKLYIDYYCPFYTIYEFVIYFGWLKVAQVMLNPFGLDDDDYEIDWLIQRDYEYGLWFLEKIYERVPRAEDVQLDVLPYTKEVAKMMDRRNPMIGSFVSHKVNEEQAKIVPSEIVRNAIKEQQMPKFAKLIGLVAQTPDPAAGTPAGMPETQEFGDDKGQTQRHETTTEFGAPTSQQPQLDVKTEKFHDDQVPTAVAAAPPAAPAEAAPKPPAPAPNEKEAPKEPPKEPSKEPEAEKKAPETERRTPRTHKTPDAKRDDSKSKIKKSRSSLRRPTPDAAAKTHPKTTPANSRMTGEQANEVVKTQMDDPTKMQNVAAPPSVHHPKSDRTQRESP